MIERGKEAAMNRKYFNGIADAIQINVWVTYYGVNYTLHLRSRRRIEDRFPEARPLPSILLGHDKREEFPKRHESYWEQMALMLTGLTATQIAELGGICIYNPDTEKVVWRWQSALKRTTA
jgi:hypothetical protein